MSKKLLDQLEECRKIVEKDNNATKKSVEKFIKSKSVFNAILVFKYSDITDKKGIIISFNKFKTLAKNKNFEKWLGDDCNIDFGDFSINEYKKGFLNIFVTDRKNSKMRYCVRIMNSKYSKTYKRIFTNNYEEVKEIIKDSIDISDNYYYENDLFINNIKQNSKNIKTIDIELKNFVSQINVAINYITNKTVSIFQKVKNAFNKKNNK